jgi:hypothetical protein
MYRRIKLNKKANSEATEHLGMIILIIVAAIIISIILYQMILSKLVQ